MSTMTRQFGGFLVATDPAVPIPRAFFTDVLPGINDIAELHVMLTIFYLAAAAGGLESPVGEEQVFTDRALRTALRQAGSPREPDQRIETGLELALGRGTLLAFSTSRGNEQRVWYYVNTPVNQALVSAMGRGAVAPPPAVWHGDAVPTVRAERPNIFRLYEQNIGLLTPLIADQLITALETYPAEWIESAVGEAVAYNRRSWRYVQRILEQWASSGREPR